MIRCVTLFGLSQCFPSPIRGSEDDYFVDGFTQELIDGLSALRGVRVYGKGAVSTWSGREADLLQIGRSLDADLLVFGSVKRLGTQLRITLRMTQTIDGIQLYVHRCECSAHELLVQAELIVAEMAGALKLREERQPRRAPSDASSVEKYLRARYLYGRSDQNSLEQSVALFEELLRSAPSDARLLLHDALALSRLWFSVVSMPHRKPRALQNSWSRWLPITALLSWRWLGFAFRPQTLPVRFGHWEGSPLSVRTWQMRMNCLGEFSSKRGLSVMVLRD